MKKMISSIAVVLLCLLLGSIGIAVSNEKNTIYSSGTDHLKKHEISENKILSGLSDSESEWYERFQQGIMFFDGWNEISENILKTFPPEMVDNKKALVKRLGIKIGSEWCRDNGKRNIDTDKLKEWGEKIKVAVAKGPTDTEQTLMEIEKEVDRLLEFSNRLSLFTPQS